MTRQRVRLKYRDAPEDIARLVAYVALGLLACAIVLALVQPDNWQTDPDSIPTTHHSQGV